MVLQEGTNEDQAASMLWRRDTRTKDKSKNYNKPSKVNLNTVVIESIKEFHNVKTVLSTSIGSSMGILNAPEILAKFAISIIKLKERKYLRTLAAHRKVEFHLNNDK